MSLYTVDIHCKHAPGQQNPGIPDLSRLVVFSSQKVLEDLRTHYHRLEVFAPGIAPQQLEASFQECNPNGTVRIRSDAQSISGPLIQVRPQPRLDKSRGYLHTGTDFLEDLIKQSYSDAADIKQITGHRVGLISNGSLREQTFQIVPELERDAFLLSRHTPLDPIPLFLSIDNQEDFIKAVVSATTSFGVLRLSGLDRDLAAESVERIRDQIEIPLIHAEDQERALLFAANLINLCANLGIELAEKNVALLGVGAESASLYHLLSQRRVARVYGIDADFRHLARFEKSGGMASSLDHVYETADMLIITPGFQGKLEEHRLQPGQVIMDYNGLMLDTKRLSPEVLEHYFQGESPHPVHILPGMAMGLRSRTALMDAHEVLQRLLPTLVTGAGRGLLPLPSNELFSRQVDALK